MIRLDAATFLLQWATGGLFFLWVTTRGRMVGLGYGWLLRGVYLVIGAGALLAGLLTTTVVVREVASVGLVLAASVALGVSVVRRRAGVSGQRDEADRKKARVAAMAGGAGGADDEVATAAIAMRDQFGRVIKDDAPVIDRGRPEFPPVLDLIAPAIGLVGLVAGGWAAGGNHLLAIARIVVGAAFLGAVSDAMLLGHWYLVQPGLSRRPIHELNDWLLRIWPVEVLLLLIPTGMISAITGSIDDGWNGMLTWFWVASALSTGILSFVTRIALKERFYSAVMAATGFLYLAILMAFGTDLVARAILAG